MFLDLIGWLVTKKNEHHCSLRYIYALCLQILIGWLVTKFCQVLATVKEMNSGAHCLILALKMLEVRHF